MENRRDNSGYATSKNAYVKHELLNRTGNKNKHSAAPPSFPSMAENRSIQGTSSELRNSTEMHKAHVPKLLLT